MGLIEDLNEYRLKNKISQEKLAEMLGVSFQTVWRWFNGKSQPSEIQEYAIKELLKKQK
ncbi:MAG: helix-turn-helix transcriptional regulator [Candidatus Omnitrophota bacterium]